MTSAQPRSYYVGSLDGLRLVAFLSVFFQHLPGPASNPFVAKHGWVGVELFFVISAFLLFHLLKAEDEKNGQVNVRNFYLRRVLRIYPLLFVYYAVMFVAGGGFAHSFAWFRFAATLLSADNIVTWFRDYNESVRAVAHLWTLSFEFQVYLLLPFVFMAWRKWGTRRFLWGLLIFEIAAFGARFWAIESGVHYPSVYVIPYLRPESILLGLTLAVVTPTWKPVLSLLAAVCAGIAFVATPDKTDLWLYFPAAVMVAGLVDAGLRYPPLRNVLAWRPFRALGIISFGLYVFHVAAIYSVAKVLQALGVTGPWAGPGITVLGLILTIAVSAASYRWLERPFLRLKLRYTAIDGRGPEGQPLIESPGELEPQDNRG
ncbi:MAG: acyltransferase family protein [Aeromicrobium sp.]